VVQKELDIGDLVLKKDIHTKNKHKFSSPWEGPLIVMDIAAPRAYVLAEVIGSMLPNTWNATSSCTIRHSLTSFLTPEKKEREKEEKEKKE
jgi:hypothetical protein